VEWRIGGEGGEGGKETGEETGVSGNVGGWLESGFVRDDRRGRAAETEAGWGAVRGGDVEEGAVWGDKEGHREQAGEVTLGNALLRL
jgi:hypothetical protein